MRLDEYLAKQDKIIQDDREKTLISLGLTEKEYAPDGEHSSWKYPEYEYRNGEKRYYRNVAIHVTDEEWALLLNKIQQVEEIKAREQAAWQQKTTKSVIRKWVPNYAPPKKVDWAGEEKPSASGKSPIARVIRWFAWLSAIGLLIAGIIALFTDDLYISFAALSASAATELVLFLAIAEALDVLAELRAIALQGVKYTESTK